jgi:5-methylcytosine-specific restriction endonuclease McrA
MKIELGSPKKRGYPRKHFTISFSVSWKPSPYGYWISKRFRKWLEFNEQYITPPNELFPQIKNIRKIPQIKKVKQIKRVKVKRYSPRSIRRYCHRCYVKTSALPHHILPREPYGGGNNKENLILLCNPCHDKVEILTDELLKVRMYSIDTLRSFIINGFPNENLEG